MTTLMTRELREQLRAVLQDSTPLQRSRLLLDLTLEVYDHVKFRAPEGGGLDGREGPERAALARVVEAAHEHMDSVTEIDPLSDSPESPR